MLMGVEYLDEGGELGIYSQGEESRLKIIYQKLLTCFDFFVPMRAAIKYIKVNIYIYIYNRPDTIPQ